MLSKDDQDLIEQLMDEHIDLYMEALREVFDLKVDFAHLPRDIQYKLYDAGKALQEAGNALVEQFGSSYTASVKTRLASSQGSDDACQIGPDFVRCQGRLYRRKM